MKKTILLLIALGITGILVIFGMGMNIKLTKENVLDAFKFKQEYEDLNSILDSNGNKKYLNINIDDNNKIKYISFNEVMDLLDKGSGVIYFGRPNCPWSRSAVEPLIEAANETDVDNIFYFNADSIRDVKHLDEDGNIVTDKEGTDEYYKLLDKLDSVVGSYKELNDETIKRLYFPTVVFVKYGKIVASHAGTVETQENPKESLNDNEKEKIKEIYKENINKTLNSVCNLDNITCENEGDNKNE